VQPRESPADTTATPTPGHEAVQLIRTRGWLAKTEPLVCASVDLHERHVRVRPAAPSHPFCAVVEHSRLFDAEPKYQRGAQAQTETFPVTSNTPKDFVMQNGQQSPPFARLRSNPPAATHEESARNPPLRLTKNALETPRCDSRRKATRRIHGPYKGNANRTNTNTVCNGSRTLPTVRRT
jgi:hypothetical protein